MKVGIPVWVGKGPFSVSVVEAIALGADYVECGLDYPWPESLKKEEASRAVKIARKKGLRFAFHSPLGDANLASPRQKIRKASVDLIKHTIRFSRQFKPCYYNLHPTASFPPTFGTVEGVAEVFLASFLLSLDEIAKFAKRERVPLVLENSTEPFFGQPEYLSLFLRIPNVRFCLDVGHAEMLNLEMKNLGLKGSSVESWIKQFRKEIFTCHFHDVLDVSDHMVLGKGSRDWKKWLRLLRKTRVENLLIETMFSEEDEAASAEDFHRQVDAVRGLLE